MKQNVLQWVPTRRKAKRRDTNILEFLQKPYAASLHKAEIRFTGRPHSKYSIKLPRLLVWRSMIDGFIQTEGTIVPQSFRNIILCHLHQPPMAAHHKYRRMYDFFKKDFCWLRMVSEYHDMIDISKSCVQNTTRHDWNLLIQICPPSKLFEFISMDILGLISLAAIRNHLVLVIIGKYSRLKRVTPKSRATVTNKANVFLITKLTHTTSQSIFILMADFSLSATF